MEVRMESQTACRVRVLDQRPILVLCLLLVGILGVLFFRSFLPGMATFSNDGPLGLMRSRVYETPGSWVSAWSDLNWLGRDAGNLPPILSSLAFWLLGPFGCTKFYPPLTIWVLGMATGLFFGQLGFRPVVCVLGGLAAALNSDFFSYTCWGLGSLTICVASVIWAMAAWVSRGLKLWMRVALAGAALGHGLMEGFDNGAILSLYVAAFVVADVCIRSSSTKPVARLRLAVLGVGGVALISGVVASHVLLALVRVNITGAEGMGQDAPSKVGRWHFATQWSLPPREALRTVIPGLYGYRMDTGGGGEYWGQVGMDPAWDRYWEVPEQDRNLVPRPMGVLRFSGAGHYAGVPVVLIALFAVAQSLRRGGGALSPEERRWVWFWAIAAVVSLLLAFGRFAPFYRLFYLLPYASTLRNPVKFLHPFSLSLIVLFGYGLQSLWRGWLDERGDVDGSSLPTKSPEADGVPSTRARRPWLPSVGWEASWCQVTLIAACFGPLAWNRYAAANAGRLLHLREVGFGAEQAVAISTFSIREVGLFALVMAVSVVVLAAILGGWFSGRRSVFAGFLLGVLVILDLGRANLPWIRYYDWREAYAPNPLTDILKEAPHEGRVAGRLPFRTVGSELGNQLQAKLAAVYETEWLQGQFRFYDIQALDWVPLPRVPADYAAFAAAFAQSPIREWQLCNARYLITLLGVVDSLNDRLDPDERRFEIRTGFDLERASPDAHRVQTNAVGPYALVEFKGALPRAKLYETWRPSVRDSEALGMLVHTNLNLHTEVLISSETPAPPCPAHPFSGLHPGRVPGSALPLTARIREYSPKRIAIATDGPGACVLLVNDRYDPRWRVRVDGQESPLLKANVVMRGVYLEPGRHEVVFTWEPPLGLLAVSITSMAGILVLAGWVALRTGASPHSGRAVDAMVPVRLSEPG